MYKSLKVLGGRGVKKVTGETTLTKEEFRGHFKRVSEERFENLPEEVERAVDRAVRRREAPGGVNDGAPTPNKPRKRAKIPRAEQEGRHYVVALAHYPDAGGR